MSIIQGGLGSGTARTNAKLRTATVMIAWQVWRMNFRYGVMGASTEISKESLCSSSNMLSGQNFCNQYSVGDTE